MSSPFSRAWQPGSATDSVTPLKSSQHHFLVEPRVPNTRYVRVGDVSIAYQVIGDGPLDLVHIPSRKREWNHGRSWCLRFAWDRASVDMAASTVQLPRREHKTVCSPSR